MADQDRQPASASPKQGKPEDQAKEMSEQPTQNVPGTGDLPKPPFPPDKPLPPPTASDPPLLDRLKQSAGQKPEDISDDLDDKDSLPKTSPFVGDPLDMEEADFPTGPLPAYPPEDSESVKKVEDAIRRLRVKMAKVATEFAEGKINQAQFEAIYKRYQDQRAITESLLARDPETNAWKHVLSEGPTSFLRSQHEAHLQAYVLYLNRTAKTVLTHGEIKISPQVMKETVQKLRASKETGVRFAEASDDRWLAYIPGRYTTAIAIYTNEPTSFQLQMVGDLHRDFETANQRNLASEKFTPKSLVFPQSALFRQ
jgi:hypothetical protein